MAFFLLSSMVKKYWGKMKHKVLKKRTLNIVSLVGFGKKKGLSQSGVGYYGIFVIHMEKIYEEVQLEEMSDLASDLLQSFGNQKVWQFIGDLGAGKTTLIKELCEKAGVQDIVQSPTFSMVNEYQTTDGEIIYHFDCYRLKNKEEALDFGIEEYLFSGNLCLVEWPQVIQSLFPDDFLTISLRNTPAGNRRVVVQTQDADDSKNGR